MIAITHVGRRAVTAVPSPRLPLPDLSYTLQARVRVGWIGCLTSRPAADRQRSTRFRAADRRSAVLRTRRTDEETQAIAARLEPRPRDHPHALGPRPGARRRRQHAQPADRLLPLR